jgi:putative transposase
MLLNASALQHALQIHAYVLMDSHVHLLISSEKVGSLSKAMRQVGQNYVSTFNHRYRRTGTLWEGRFKSCLVDSDRYLLTVYRYIELNPVHAAMVEMPEHYPWSSVHANLASRSDSIVTPHETFLAIAADRGQRAEAYRAWLRAGVSDDELTDIRQHIKQERALGGFRFQAMAEKTLGRSVIVRQQGRPRRQPTDKS